MSRAVPMKKTRLAAPAFLSAPHNRRSVLVVSAGVVGGGVGAAYLGALALTRRYLGPTHWSLTAHLVVMVVVGIAITLLVRLLGRPGDVELLVDNIHVGGGAEDVRSLRSLIPISLLAVGTGGPLGPEAPLVTTTGSIAAWLGHRGGLSADDRRIVSITGMAAGFTVLFGAPLGSALFALEILHRRGLEYYEALLPAAIGSVCGYAISTALTGVGLDPVWHLPAPVSIKPADLGYAVAAGVVGAVVAAAFTYLTIGIRRLAVSIPEDLRPILGGLVFGA